jgi:hypothetical protein
MCSVGADCLPATICTAHTVTKCQDGHCVCALPEIIDPKGQCSADGDCGEVLNCDERTVAKCDSGWCKCLALASSAQTTLST